MLDSLTRSFKKLVSKKHSVVLPQPQGITTNEKLREITKQCAGMSLDTPITYWI